MGEPAPSLQTQKPFLSPGKKCTCKNPAHVSSQAKAEWYVELPSRSPVLYWARVVLNVQTTSAFSSDVTAASRWTSTMCKRICPSHAVHAES